MGMRRLMGWDSGTIILLYIHIYEGAFHIIQSQLFMGAQFGGI